MQHAMQPQQQPMDPSSMIPTSPKEASQGYHQQQSRILTQNQSPATVQGEVSPHEFIPASNVFLNPDCCQSVQQNGTHFPPDVPGYTPYQTVSNNQDGDNSVATLTSSPGSLVQHGMELAHHAAINQQPHPEQMDHNYPATQNFDLMHTPTAVPSANIHAWAAPQDCLCGPNCNCLFCRSHPYNPATSERIQDLGNFMASESYWKGFPPNLSQPAVNPMDDPSFTSNPLGYINMPKPTFDEGESVNDSDQSNGFASPQMMNEQYQTMEYLIKIKNRCTDATGTCLCSNNCTCPGCRTHRGHVETPNVSVLPHL